MQILLTATLLVVWVSGTAKWA